MKKWLMMLLILTCTTAFAGNEAGNGGDALYRNGNLYMLDLVEAGAEEKPYLSESFPVDAKILVQFEKTFDANTVPLSALTKKMSEIKSLDALLAESLLHTMKSFSWRWVNSELVDIRDEDSSLDYPVEDLVQVAVRRSRSILVNRQAWEKMDVGNRVALIYHEIVYALIKEKSGSRSPRAREITGSFFTRDLSVLGAIGLYRVIGDTLPTFELKKLREELDRLSLAVPGFISHDFEKVVVKKNLLLAAPVMTLNQGVILLSDIEIKKETEKACKSYNLSKYGREHMQIEIYAAPVRIEIDENGTNVDWALGIYGISERVKNFSVDVTPKNCQIEVYKKLIEGRSFYQSFVNQ